uniref:Uncharacterized protein n=1 Tax=Arundo donax TaxID=35708 RepID=A0A0A8XN37_ARUDO
MENNNNEAYWGYGALFLSSSKTFHQHTVTASLQKRSKSQHIAWQRRSAA